MFKSKEDKKWEKISEIYDIRAQLCEKIFAAPPFSDDKMTIYLERINLLTKLQADAVSEAKKIGFADSMIKCMGDIKLSNINPVYQHCSSAQFLYSDQVGHGYWLTTQMARYLLRCIEDGIKDLEFREKIS